LVKPTRAGTLIRAVNQTIGRMSEVAADSKRPLAVPARAGKAPTIEEALAAGRLILVAEDNAVNRLVIGKQLTELGYAFETSNDGEAAWEMLQQKRYGLLLTDCFMPRLDGYDLTRRIRRKEAQEGGRLPVVALTANVLEGEAEKCYAASMDDYLSKPVFLDRLAAALERWLPAVANPEADDSATPDEAPAAVAAAAEPDEEPPISLENFAEILGTDDPDTLREILAFFVETFTQSLAALHQALAARDRPSLRNAAHAAKGAARNACASLLAAGLEELEHKALTREPFNRLAERVEAAEKAFASVRAMVDKL
jgi:CheY-like chemotaxis protein/HPt (histidine-containing phosphotransfer) domain-containing protein